MRVPDREGRAPDGFELHRCAACDLVYVWPPTSDEELAAYYDDAFYGADSDVSSGALRVFHALRARVVERARSEPGRLLDVGCGDGRFLATMRERGWDVHGVETADEGRRRAQRRLGDDAVDGELSDAPRRGEDVITLWHVLEHVTTPLPFLAALRERLADGGALVVAVPHYDGAEARLFRDAWFHLDVPRHQLHFSRTALTELLARAGFDVVDEGGFSLEYDPFGTLQSTLNKVGLDFNALYRWLKRGVPLRDLSWRGRAAIASAVSLGPWVVPAAAVAGAIAARAGRGATLTVIARPM